MNSLSIVGKLSTHQSVHYQRFYCIHKLESETTAGWGIGMGLLLKIHFLLHFCRDSELKMNNRMPFFKMKERFPHPLFTQLPCLSRGEGT